MKVNQIVFDKNNGLGIVKSDSDGNTGVMFLDEVKSTSLNIEEIPSSFFNYVLSGDYKRIFNSASLKKGKDYYLSKKTKLLTYHDNKLEFKSKGTYDYYVSLETKGRSFFTKCSCPVGFNCKHGASAFILLEEAFKRLDVNREKMSDNDNTNLKCLFKNICYGYTNELYKEIKLLVDNIIKSLSLELLVEILGYFINFLPNNKNSKLIFQALYLNDKIRPVFLEASALITDLELHRSLLVTETANKNIIDSRYNELMLLNDRKSKILYYFYNDEFDLALKGLLMFYIDRKFFKEIYYLIIDKVMIDDSYYDYIYAFLESGKYLDDVLKDIINKLSKQLKKILYQRFS